MRSKNNRKTEVVIRDLSNETKHLEFQYNYSDFKEFPRLSNEKGEKKEISQKEKIENIMDHLKNLKEEYKLSKKLELKELAKEKISETYNKKKTMNYGIPNHPKFFQKQIKQIEYFENQKFLPFNGELNIDKENDKKTTKSSNNSLPWIHRENVSEYFEKEVVKRQDSSKFQLSIRNITREDIKTKKEDWAYSSKYPPFFEQSNGNNFDIKLKWKEDKFKPWITTNVHNNLFQRTIYN